MGFLCYKPIGIKKSVNTNLVWLNLLEFTKREREGHRDGYKYSKILGKLSQNIKFLSEINNKSTQRKPRWN